jgi:phosphoribosyl 1,2-cyclic phosphodiesterase
LSDDPSFFVRFWGVRGSIACPGIEYSKYGGNTSCLEVRCGSRLLIFDAGSGLRLLGQHIDKSGPVDADLFFTHSHLDHVGGLPFFTSAFRPANKFRFWSGHLLNNDVAMRDVIGRLMSSPLFPVPIEVFQADLEFRDFEPGKIIDLDETVRVRTAPLNHPQGAVGYRVEYEDKAICFVSDTEHCEGRLDDNIVELIQDADIMIYDATYTDEEYPRHAGWGHSTWQEGIKLCEATNVKQLVLFHHDPGHDDAAMDAIGREAAVVRPGTLVASEGMTLAP